MTFPFGRRGRREQDLADELRGHLQMAVRDRVERGEAPVDAGYAARREFGNVDLITEVTRDVWGWSAFHQFGADLRYAIRVLAKSPGFTAIVVIILALGIGANTAIFSAAEAVFLRALPYPDEQRLMFVSRAYPGYPQGGGNFSYPAARDIGRQNSSFDVFAAYQDFGALALSDAAEPVRVRVCYITPSYFELLGVTPAAGRLFRQQEDRFGGGDAVAVLSYGLWQRQYAGARDIVGRTVHFNQRAFTVIGVAAATFRDAPAEHEDPEPVDAWVPLGLAHDLTGMSGAADRAGAITWGIGRLKPGVTVEQANADLAAIAKRLDRAYPATDGGYGLVARPLRDQLVGEFYSPVRVLVGGSAFILLIGCANVANLLLARLLARRRELAMRAALGASAGRLVQQLLVEHLVLAIAAGTLGLVGAVWGVAALNASAARHLPTVMNIHVDRSMLAASVVLSMLTGLLFGVLPGITGARVDLREALSQNGRQGAVAGRRAAAKILVVVEVALAMALLVGAGLLLKSVHRLTSTDLGFNTRNLLTLRLDLRSARYATPRARAQFGERLVETVRPLAGVESVTLWGPSMLGRATWVIEAVPEGLSADDPHNILMFERHSVNPGGLANLGIRLLSGRDFNEHDTDTSPLVAVISQSLANTWWPGQNPIGKHFTRPFDQTATTVIGLAADARHRERFALADAAIGIPPGALGPQRDSYFAYAQRPNTALVVAVRIAGDAAAMSQTLRRAVLAVDPALPVYDLALLDDRLADQERGSRILAAVTAAYAALALFLAAFGLFGVLAHAVRRRTQEIGIRMALGGLPRSVLAMVLREGLGLTIAGIGCGLAGAALLTRALTSVLFGVSPSDPLVYAAISVLLLAVAAAACAIPAIRAMHVDPMVALRAE
jgi:putative ABC transport system permease protein